MFAMKDEKKRLITDEPAANMFDGPTSGRALSMRYSCDYPGSIINQLRNSQVPEQCVTPPQTKADMKQNVGGTSSDMVAPPGECNETSSSSDSDDDNCTLPDVSLVADSARCSKTARENSNREVRGSEASGSLASQIEETIVRRQKNAEPLSCTDTDSDREISASEYVSKNKLSHTKLRKRRRKVTANLAGTRYDVGKH